MDIFEDIRPYNDDEVKDAYFRLMDDKRFQDAVARFLPDYTVDDLRREFPNFHSVEDVQIAFMKRWIEMFIAQSTSGYDFSGIERLDPNAAYTFVSNHRDITFDPALLEYYCFLANWRTTKIAVGDNLMSTPLLTEVARLNKMFLVKRSGTLREKLTNFQLLSSYIQYSVLEEKESIWIAQRDGRTKDGNDATKHALIKMITMGHDKDLIGIAKRMNLTPMAISYEYEPCDRQKARELALSESGPYKKRPGEDFDSIKSGIFDHKGRISLTIGKPLQEELDTIPEELSNNDKLLCICQLIDTQIYDNYKLYPNNYIANDMQNGSPRYAAFYSAAEREKFEQYINRRAVVQDVTKEKMMEYLLKIYATPVDNHYNTPDNRRVEDSVKI